MLNIEDITTDDILTSLNIIKDDPDIIDMGYACDTCYLYNRGIPCGVEAGVCKQEVFIDGDLSR